MSENKIINTNQFSFSKSVDEILQNSSPNFNFKKIAKLGLETKFITSQEAEQLINLGDLPKVYFSSQEANTKEYLSKNNSFKEEILLHENRIDISAPNTLDASISFHEKFLSSKKKSPEIKLIQGLKSSHYLGNFKQFSWDDSGILKHDSNRLRDQTINRLKEILDYKEPVTLGNTFHAVVEGSSIYTHWMLDTLPRFLMLAEKGIDINSFDHIVVAAANKHFQQIIIKKLEIDPSKIIQRSKIGNCFKCDSFSYITQPRLNFAAHKSSYKNVIDFVKKDSLNLKSSYEKIYISREKASRRRVLNEKHLTEFLYSCGYETVYFEELELENAVSLVSNASCIIAPHGAGLSNLIYAQPKTKVVEIFSGHISVEYWYISQQMGLNYNLFQADFPNNLYENPPINLKDLNHKDRNHMDIKVNISRLRDFLENLNMI